jgi:hypothetical protein
MYHYTILALQRQSSTSEHFGQERLSKNSNTKQAHTVDFDFTTKEATPMEIRDIPFVMIRKIRMQYMVPIMRAMEEKFGKDAVHAVLEQY